MTTEQYRNGWIKLHRILLDKAIWKCSRPNQKVILVTILLMANYKQSQWVWKGKKYVCQPGEFITSASAIAKLAGIGINRQAVRTALSGFCKKYDFLTTESTNESTKVTIQNWKEYQIVDDVEQKDQPADQPADQPTCNQRVTTNKESKELKEHKEKKGAGKKKPAAGLKFDFKKWPNLNSEAWKEFEEHRVDIKKPLTDKARVKNLGWLMRYSNGNHAIQQKIIDNTIMSRWTRLCKLSRDDIMELENKPQKPQVTHDLTQEEIAAATAASEADRQRHEDDAARFEQEMAGLTPEEREAKICEMKQRKHRLIKKLKNRSSQAFSSTRSV
jgi:hypothetical protein